MRALHRCRSWFLLAALATLGAPMFAARAAEDVRGIWIINRDGTGLKRLTAEPLPGLTNCGTPEWSPDGTRIVCDATVSKEWRKSHIVVIHVAGTQAGTIQDLGLGVQPTWSPDGESIAFYMNPGTLAGVDYGMWCMDANGNDRTRLGAYIQPRWMPSGLWLVSTQSFSKSRQLRVLEPKLGLQSETIELPDAEFVYKPSFLTDTAFVSALNLNAEPVLGIVDLSERPCVKKVVYDQKPECKQPRVSPDGTECVCIRTMPQRGNQLYVISLTDPEAEPEPLEPESGVVWVKDPAWSPDGKRIVFSCTEREGPVEEFFSKLPPESIKLLQPTDANEP